jgi:lipopolysaccharide exporter
MLKNDLKFKKISTLDILAKILSFIATISFAFVFENYWALILGNIVSAIVIIVGSYVIAPCMPTFTFSNIKEQFHFSKNVFLMTVLGYLRNKIDILIVSQKFGSAGAGYYSLAQEFSILPYTEVIEPISQPLYTSLARTGEDVNSQAVIINKYLSVVYSLLVPSICGIMLLSKDIVHILFGEQWADTAPVLAYLSALMVVFATNGAFKHIFVLSGRFKGAMLLDVFGIVLILSALLINHLDSTQMFAQYRVFVGLIIYLLSLLLVKTLLRVSLYPTILALIVPIFGSAVMLVFLVILKENSLQLDSVFLNTVMMIFSGFIVYLATWLGFIYFLRDKHFIWAFDYALVGRFRSKFMNIYSKIYNRYIHS